jgi:hypothetical protein
VLRRTSSVGCSKQLVVLYALNLAFRCACDGSVVTLGASHDTVAAGNAASCTSQHDAHCSFHPADTSIDTPDCGRSTDPLLSCGEMPEV